ncbi:MAG: hypothetical protein ABFD89_16620 [Bryobacteraceae bacterium]
MEILWKIFGLIFAKRIARLNRLAYDLGFYAGKLDMARQLQTAGVAVSTIVNDSETMLASDKYEVLAKQVARQMDETQIALFKAEFPEHAGKNA